MGALLALAFLVVVVAVLRFLALRTAKTDDMDEALEAVRGRGGVSLALAFFLTLKTVRFLAVVVDFEADLAVVFAALGVAHASLMLSLPDGRLWTLMGVNGMAA